MTGAAVAFAPVETPPWTRAMCLSHAQNKCAHCHGRGQHYRRGRMSPCNCVLRRIFSRCWLRYERLAVNPYSRSNRWELRAGRVGINASTRPGNSDWICDFELIARRTLDAEHWRVFELHYLRGLEWGPASRRLRMDRGTFFHCVYRTQQRLGRAFAETKPWAIFPVEDYFSLTWRDAQRREPQPVRRAIAA